MAEEPIVNPPATEPSERDNTAADAVTGENGNNQRPTQPRETSRSVHLRKPWGWGQEVEGSRLPHRRSRGRSMTGARTRSNKRSRHSRSRSRSRWKWRRRSRRSRSTSVLSGISDDNAHDDSCYSYTSDKENRAEEDRKESSSRKRKPRSPTQEAEVEDSQSAKRKRFQAKSEEEQRDWSLKKKDTRYINNALATYISNKTLEDSISKDNLVPRNIDKPEQLDDT